METIKALPPKSLDTFCAIFDFAKGQADITCPASDYPTACLRALERRGLIAWDTERQHSKTERYAALTELGAHYGCETLALQQALVPNDTTGKRKRVWVKVQFDLNDEDYQAAWGIAGDLAQARLLAPTIRDLLQIHEAADRGDYSLFYQLYGIPETKETAQFETMIKTFADMQQTINALTAKLGSLQNATQATVEAVNSDLLEDDDTVLLKAVKDENAGKRASENFLRSVSALNPAPVVIPQAGVPRVLSVPSLPMPSFEDDEINP